MTANRALNAQAPAFLTPRQFFFFFSSSDSAFMLCTTAALDFF